MRPHPTFALAAAALLLCGLPSLRAQSLTEPLITEFMADNENGLTDETGLTHPDWIELHNPSAAPVSLLNWALTDNAASLRKWVFPAITLQPGDFLVVFADGKNLRNPASPLHTNFSLSAGGEYLALTRPNGTIAQDFGPAYPPMKPDESYGFKFASQTLVAPGAPVKYRNATKGLPADWKLLSGSETGWLSGTTGLGYGILVPGWRAEEAKSSTADVTSFARADALLSGVNRLSSDVRIRPKINILGDGADHLFPASDLPALGGEDYTIRATATLNIPATGDYTFMISSDDGGRLLIDGASVITSDVLRGPTADLASRNLTAGLHTITAQFYEHGGGDEFEVAAAPGVKTAFDASFKLIGDTAAGGLAVYTAPGGSTSIIGTDISSTMLGITPTVWTRLTFTPATSLAGFDNLSLQMRYSDGFVAWLNGVEVARSNAVDPIATAAVATGSRSLTDAVVPVSFNISSALPLLNPTGPNLLAITGLNVSATDSTFLIQPALTAGDLDTASGAFHFRTPTPGTLNINPGYLGTVADTVFLPKRGVYTTPQSVTITSATPGATIRYTTDGSEPTATTGTVYTGPIPVAATSTIRAAAFKANYDPTNIDTHTYLFFDDIVTQNTAGSPPPGWPSVARAEAEQYSPVGNGQWFNYGMDPAIIDHTNPAIGGRPQVKAALQALPSVFITTTLPNLTDPGTGIYTHAYEDGQVWERPASIEMLNDPATPEGGFQKNCGLRIRGGYSRSETNPKHAFRILFTSDYGSGSLNYPIYPNDDFAAQSFAKFDIQTAQNYSWSFGGDGSNLFLRELWCRDAQLATGHPSTHGRFVHLYLNGQYWGMYQIEERAEANFGESYGGGDKNDYDVVKVETSLGYQINPTAGDLNAYQDLFTKGRACYWMNRDLDPAAGHAAHAYTQTEKNAAFWRLMGRQTDGVTPSPADPVLLDLDGLIDYMLVIFFTGNADSPLTGGAKIPNNYYGLRNKLDQRGFFFVQHDGEHSTNTGAGDRTGPFYSTTPPPSGFSGTFIGYDTANLNDAWEHYADTFNYYNPQFLHQDLLPSVEYRKRFADRVQKHMIAPGGALTKAQNKARATARAATVESAIIAESARWGDSKLPTSPLTAANWRAARDAFLAWFDTRNATVITQLKADSLFPTVDAPSFRQNGGTLATAADATFIAGGPTIYYTVDVTDPRLQNDAISPSARVFTPPAQVTDTLVSDGVAGPGASWKYRDPSIDLGSSDIVAGHASYNATNWKHPQFDDSNATVWKTGDAELGNGDTADGRPERTAINIGPSGARYAALYFRKKFTVTSTSQYDSLSLDALIDDGAIFYLNGREVARLTMPAGAVGFAYSGVGAANEAAFLSITDPRLAPSALVAGENTMCVEVHQATAVSSDLSFDLRLKGTRVSSVPPLTGLPAAPAIFTVNGRSRDVGGLWSALATSEYLLGAEKASAANLAVTELMYHPLDPSGAELAVNPGWNQDDFEFVEVQNTGALSVDLRGIYFSNGLTWTCTLPASSALLAPGARAVIVKNTAAFRARYGAGPVVIGDYTGQLDNGGEQLTLKAADFSIIRDLTYDDTAPWPSATDGTGYSLVLAGTDPALPASWRTSAAPGGNPGISDASTFTSFKTAYSLTSDNGDADNDGISNFYEYALGSSPTQASTASLPVASVVSYSNGAVPPVLTPCLSLTFLHRTTADDVAWTIETSPDLATPAWSPAGAILVSDTPDGNGTSTATWRTAAPFAGPSRLFIRARASLR